MPVYGSPTKYGAGVYGTSIKPKSNNLKAKSVGTQYDVSLAGIGCILAPVKDRYNKKAAQSWSYNPKSLFKQGDGAALNPRDLYYWNRLEHGTWDGGETFAPWAPDPSKLNRQSDKYLTSVGFDVTNPRKLVHQREIYASPNYKDASLNPDSPILWWKLTDAKTTDGVLGGVRDEIGPNTTPGTSYGVAYGYSPGPIANDPSTAAVFTGPNPATSLTLPDFTTSILLAKNATGDLRAPFPSRQVPANTWSADCWVRPSKLSQDGGGALGPVMFLVGGETVTSGGSGYQGAVSADNPLHWYKMGEASAPLADSGTGTTQSLSEYSPQDGSATSPTYSQAGIPGDTGTSVLFGAGIKGLHNGTNFVDIPGGAVTLEAWVYPTSLSQQGAIMAWGNNFELLISGNGWGVSGAGLYLVNSSNTFYSLGYTFGSANTWYHVVLQFNGSNSVTLFINGTSIGTTAVSNSLGAEITIGEDHTANNPHLVGRVQHEAIYSGTLSSARILAHYNAGNNVAQLGVGFGLAIASVTGGVGNKLIGHFPGAATVWHDSGYTFTTEDIWYHIGVTSTAGGLITYYVNGAAQPNTITQPVSTGDAWTFVGCTRDYPGSYGNPSFRRFFRGKIGQFALYNSTLSAARMLNHYNLGAGNLNSITPNQTYARFIETFDGKLWINQANTNVLYSTDGGLTWTKVVMPGGDVTTINAMWIKDTKIYVATATNVYVGDSGGFAAINATTHANIKAGIYYSGQLYVGIGTTLRYIDPTTGAETTLFDTGNFNVTFTEAFNGKIWFGGTTTSGRYTRVYTWTNNTLPPSAANGTGAQIQDGTIPYGFIVRTSTVYLNNLLLAGTQAGDTTSEGQGTVYYVTPGGQFGQLCLVGPLMKDIRGTGLDYGVYSIWGAENKLFMGNNHKVGVAIYDFSKGAFSNHVETSQYAKGTGNIVLAVTYHQGHALFAVQVDGNIWKESTNKVAMATLDESEFVELAFLDKLIDGAEGTMSDLLTGQSIEVQLSTDYGATYTSLGVVYDSGNAFDFKPVNTLAKHWRTRLVSRRGLDPTKAPEMTNWSIRFAPILNNKHEWIMDLFMPAVRKVNMGAIITETNQKLTNQLWAAHENGTVVDFIDRDGSAYKVLVMEINQIPYTHTPVRAQSSATDVRNDILHVELLEVQRIVAKQGGK